MDAHFHDWAGRVLLSVWPIKATNTFLILHNGQLLDWLPDLQGRKLLTLCWRSVSESGREGTAFSIAYKASQYVISQSVRRLAMQRNHDVKQHIVDAPLTLILPRVYLHYGTIHFGIVYD